MKIGGQDQMGNRREKEKKKETPSCNTKKLKYIDVNVFSFPKAIELKTSN